MPVYGDSACSSDRDCRSDIENSCSSCFDAEPSSFQCSGVSYVQIDSELVTSSPAAVPFNQEKRNKSCIAALKARVAKREKKAASVLARAAGKAAAAEKRAYIQAEWDTAVRKGREEIEKKTASARKAMGVRKNEANPASICQMIERWEMDMAVALYAARMMNAA